MFCFNGASVIPYGAVICELAARYRGDKYCHGWAWIIGNSTTLLALLKRIKPASAVRHGVRISTIVAKTSFWVLCYHYFGPKTLLYVVASWTFVLGVKDLTFARVRLSSIRNPKKRSRAYVQSVSAELVLLALRVGAVFALVELVTPFNQDVAATLPIIAVVAGFWARETMISTASVFGSGSLRIYVAMVAAFAALGSIFYFAENNLDPVHSAVWAMLVREGLTFFGFALVAILGCIGVRTRGEADDDDDEDGAEAMPILGPDGREIRAAWKLLIADNVIYSRWRIMHFATRFVAHGVAGPFGGVVARIFFAYRKPKPYVHHSNRLPVGKILSSAFAAAVVIMAVVFGAQKAGLLHAVGIAAAAFLFRLAAMSFNFMVWRQLSPIVGAPKKRRLVPDEVPTAERGEGNSRPLPAEH